MKIRVLCVLCKSVCVRALGDDLCGRLVLVVWVCAACAARMGVWDGTFSSFLSPLFCLCSEHSSQSALAVPLTESLASLSIAIVLLFAQSLAARMLSRAWAGHGHRSISAYGI